MICFVFICSPTESAINPHMLKGRHVCSFNRHPHKCVKSCCIIQTVYFLFHSAAAASSFPPPSLRKSWIFLSHVCIDTVTCIVNSYTNWRGDTIRQMRYREISVMFRRIKGQYLPTRQSPLEGIALNSEEHLTVLPDTKSKAWLFQKGCLLQVLKCNTHPCSRSRNGVIKLEWYL